MSLPVFVQFLRGRYISFLKFFKDHIFFVQLCLPISKFEELLIVDYVIVVHEQLHRIQNLVFGLLSHIFWAWGHFDETHTQEFVDLSHFSLTLIWVMINLPATLRTCSLILFDKEVSLSLSFWKIRMYSAYIPFWVWFLKFVLTIISSKDAIV